MRTPLAAAAVLLALQAAPAPGAPLRAAGPEPAVSGVGDRRAEFSELRTAMAGMEPLLQELHVLAQEEAAAEDAGPFIPRRKPLIARLSEMLSDLEKKNAAFDAKNRMLLVSQGTLLMSGRMGGKGVDAASSMAVYVESNDLYMQLEKFIPRAKAGIQEEQSAFEAAQARTAVHRAERRLRRRLAAGGAGAAVVLLAFAVWRRRQAAS